MTHVGRADFNDADALVPNALSVDPCGADTVGGDVADGARTGGDGAHPKGADGARLPFRLVVEWAQALAGRSVTMVGGRWEQGTFYPGDLLELIPASGDGPASRQVRGTHIDAFGAPGSDQLPRIRFGVVVEGIGPSEVSAGDILQALS